MAAARQEFGRTPSAQQGGQPRHDVRRRRSGSQRTLAAADSSNTASSPSRRRRRCRDCSTCRSSGQLFVTPIVALIHQIPLVGDVLHPFIGYPVQFGLPRGHPGAAGRQGDLVRRHADLRALLPGDRTCRTADRRRPSSTVPAWPFPVRRTTCPRRTSSCRTTSSASVRCARPATTSSRGILAVNGIRAASWRSTRPDFEAHDVSAIISWLATQPEVQLDDADTRPADRHGRRLLRRRHSTGRPPPIDDRIDAIVPTIAWHSLTTSLYKNQAFKSSWGTLLTVALLGTLARPNPRHLPRRDHRRPHGPGVGRPTRTCWTTGAPATWSTRSPRRRC